MTEETMDITKEIISNENNGIRIESYTLDGKKPEIFMSPGDLYVICNVLHDYASALGFFAEEKEGYEKALYEIHVERCRNIQRHIESEIGYNVEAAIRKCLKKKNKTKENDVGEDAFTLAVRQRRKKEEEKKNVNENLHSEGSGNGQKSALEQLSMF